MGQNPDCQIVPQIVLMTEQDVLSVVQLEVACGLSSRGADAYLNALQQANSLLLIAVQQDSDGRQVLGIFSGDIVVDELQIDNVAVAMTSRRRGIGNALLNAALKQAQALGACSGVLEVRAQNLAAVSLYERVGFITVGRRKRYYQNPPDDALILQCDLVKWHQNAA
ncbi:MAG: GNAT family N-acetyltransferase [Acidobacteria bacterium]|nr:GNAT family N-acetyltransferase [Acidobacteriota bacterium]